MHHLVLCIFHLAETEKEAVLSLLRILVATNCETKTQRHFENRKPKNSYFDFSLNATKRIFQFTAEKAQAFQGCLRLEWLGALRIFAALLLVG